MFIVIEGIDGAGCETQAKMIESKLSASRQSPVTLIKYPHYDDAVGEMIREFLYKNKNLSAQEQFLLYCLQFLFDSPRIKEFLSSQSPTTNHQPPIIVADRYFTTALCYQTLEGVDETKALRFAQDFGIIKPDLVFFLDVKPETAWRWKHGEVKEKNFREEDLDFMKKTYEKYQDLVRRQVWTNWVTVDGERNKKVIADEIVKRVLENSKCKGLAQLTSN